METIHIRFASATPPMPRVAGTCGSIGDGYVHRRVQRALPPKPPRPVARWLPLAPELTTCRRGRSRRRLPVAPEAPKPRHLCPAKRFQELWNDKEGTVIGLLTSKCKVKIETEGQTYGQVHNYEPKYIQKIAGKRPAPASGNLPAAAPEPPNKKQATLSGLFGSPGLAGPELEKNLEAAVYYAREEEAEDDLER